MANPVEISFDSDKTAILAALPKAAKAEQASVHGIHADHGLASIRFDDGRLLYLHIMEKNDSKTIIRFGPSVSYLGDKDAGVIPENDINKFSRQMKGVLGV